jgi:ParB family chromosome partitioning protein
MKKQFMYLSVEFLQRGKYQPRKDFDREKLTELSQSIVQQGLIEPIIVRALAENLYEIIAGERRWRAAMEAGLEEVPCVLGVYSDAQTAAITLIENIQREELNPIEEACGYQCLIAEFHYHQEELGQMVGKSRSHIANLLRLLTLSPFVQSLIKEKKLTLGHARNLVGLSEETQASLANQALIKNWSVRRMEEEARKIKNLCQETSSINSQDTAFLENHISNHLNTPVEIDTEAKGGWLKIKFYDNDTLTGILERIGLQLET